MTRVTQRCEAYITPPAMVQSSKPPLPGDRAITDKSGGCKGEADLGKEPMFTRRSSGNVGMGTVTGGADVQESNQPTSKGKGRVTLRASQARGVV